MRDLWQMWSGSLPEQSVKMILDKASNNQVERATTFSSEASSVRSSQVSWLSEDQEVLGLLWPYVEKANITAFGVNVSSDAEIQYTEYHSHEGGHYDWHIDVNWDNEEVDLDRKLSVTVQLSDPSEYEGGDFEFSECPTPDPKHSKLKGTVLVFPSYLQHRVLPVTSGMRKSLVAWFSGPRWQ